MPRGPRLDASGVLHHVMARGLDRQSIFRDNHNRDDFVRRLASLAEAGALVVSAWALLPNHCHLLVRTARKPLPRAMRSLLTGYAGAFNRRHRPSGHLLQNRYKSLVVEEEPYCLELVRYLHLNPVRAGVVANLRGLDRYPYSGHATVMGAGRPGGSDGAGGQATPRMNGSWGAPSLSRACAGAREGGGPAAAGKAAGAGSATADPASGSDGRRHGRGPRGGRAPTRRLSRPGRPGVPVGRGSGA
jgi:REP element-mobilizing transposase RayT